MTSQNTRRQFLKTSAAALAATHLPIPWSSADADESRSPNEIPVVGMIGTGIRFAPLIRAGSKYTNCASVCDIDTRQSSKAAELAAQEQKKNGRTGKIKIESEYRRLIDRKDIDALVIGTPDHWHTKIAIEAMQAGKDIYCEKPLTLTIREGQQILEVLNKTKRVFQVGTQQRSDFGQRFVQAVALVQNGRIGKPTTVTCAIGGSPTCPALKTGKAPAELDWETWLGQAPKTDYLVGDIIHPSGWGAGFPLGRTHRYFRWFYEYSGGKLTDWGAHHLDIALWAMGKLDSGMGRFTIDPVMAKHPVPFKNGMPTVSDRFNAASEFRVNVRFSDGATLAIRDSAQGDLGFSNGIMFQGTKSRFLVNRSKIVGGPINALKSNPLPSNAIEKVYGGPSVINNGGDPIAHMKNWVSCIKSRKKPISDVESHHRMLSVCHGANIAMRLGRKLTFDSKTESFVGDEQANSFIEREQRKGYEIKV
jgi:predicted dehydrogenase